MPKTVYSDFFGCHFVIYHDPYTGKCLTKKCKSIEEANLFKDSLEVGRNLWYNKDWEVTEINLKPSYIEWSIYGGYYYAMSVLFGVMIDKSTPLEYNF